MAITPLPEAPLRSDPVNFSEKAENWVAALDQWTTEANALAVAMNFNSTTSVSTTSLTIGTGTKSLTVEASKSFVPGMSVKIAYTSGANNWMFGDVTAYNSVSGAMTVEVTDTQGSGTQSAWTVSLSAPSVTSLVMLIAKTGNYSVTAGDMCGSTIFTNKGAAGMINFSLPAGASNYKCAFVVVENYFLKVTASGIETFRYYDEQSAAGGYIRSDEVGTTWEIVWSGDEWVIRELVGELYADE